MKYKIQGNVVIKKELIALLELPITLRKTNFHTLACKYKLNNNKCN